MPPRIFLDESGDLGWNLTKPYRRGGSSRFLTIAYLIVAEYSLHFPKRVIRDTYNRFKFNPKVEVKGSQLTEGQLDFFVAKACKMFARHPDLQLGAITVKKENVQPHIRSDENKLYNYMIRLALMDKIDPVPTASIIRDERSIKVKSGRSLIDYLQTVLWFDRRIPTKLQDYPTKSHTSANLLFIDWIAHIVWSSYEDGYTKHFSRLHPSYLTNKTLFF
jgi:hypothetical protein